MARINFKQYRLVIALIILSSFLASCTSSATSRYFGQTAAPQDNVLRYVTGSEPESLDTQFVTGQPEARIMMALYDGLVEYHPKTMEPIPAIAESWEIGTDGTEYLFHLRKNAKFSNGDPITAKDFVYTFRRGLTPEFAARNAYLAYYLKYAEAYNSGQSFVKDASGQFLLKKDFAEPNPNQPAETAAPSQHDTLGGDSEFHRFLDSPERLYVPSDEKARAKILEKDAKLKAALEGKELVPVKAEDIGIEAVDDYTVRIKLYQPAPFFLGLLGLLDGIEFYPLDEQTTMMNLYKAGRVDALYNHTVPAAWNENIRQYKDEYLLHPEVATEFYVISVKKPPMDNLKVRQAFALAINREALAEFRKTIKPLTDMTPEGIFPKYEEARKKVYAEKLKENNIPPEEWAKRIFDPEKARKLMTEAGYPVQKSGSGYSTPTFPVDKVSITYNTAESNKAVAEFVQAQWKQNLGITVPLKNLEFKTYLPMLSAVEYEGFGRRGWVGDYMDPFTFLGLFYTTVNEGATGWWDPKYDAILNEANNTVDPQKRFEKLAEAEFYLAQQQIVIPLSTAGTSWMKKPYVKGFYPNPGTMHAWKFVYIERDANKWDANVDNIMKDSDPAVDAQISLLTATQEQMEKSKTTETDKVTAAAAE
ncbi:MAG: peptide ABC transporter substrate-binding protein [Acidobacteria bacterium]|nr:peptide ABC transporter substrate-binding protein [Acidobacteriota bacterium]